MDISISEARKRLSYWVDRLGKARTIRITRHGKPVGVLIDSAEYDRLRKGQAYLETIRISRQLSDSGLTARELYRASRSELEWKT